MCRLRFLKHSSGTSLGEGLLVLSLRKGGRGSLETCILVSRDRRVDPRPTVTRCHTVYPSFVWGDPETWKTVENPLPKEPGHFSFPLPSSSSSVTVVDRRDPPLKGEKDPRQETVYVPPGLNKDSVSWLLLMRLEKRRGGLDDSLGRKESPLEFHDKTSLSLRVVLPETWGFGPPDPTNPW